MSWVAPTIVVGAVAAALNAGTFFAFSNFVMPALSDLSPHDGATSMQAINRHAPNPFFVGTIVGAGVIGVPVLVAEWDRRATHGFRWMVVAVALSLVSLIVTVVCNAPRNDRLAALDRATADAAAYWSEYVLSWTRWNTIRTLTSAGSVAAYALALRGR